MRNNRTTHAIKSTTAPLAAAHLGAAIVALRRRAQKQLSPFHTKRLLAVADGMEILLPAIERLETVCEVRHV